MILNHLWGLYAHPHTEWHTIDERHDSFRNSLTHILLVALIPPICAYYSAVHIGWSIGVGDPITLTANSAFKLSVAMYVTLIIGVLALSYLVHWMGHTFGSDPSYTTSRIPVKLNSDSGICEHHFRKVCGQGFFEQKLSFEGRHLFDSPNKPAAKRSAAVVDPGHWSMTVHLTSEFVL